MKEGYTVTYNPSASVYTYVPETLKEFYHQRLRWTPTIVPNTLEILSYWKGMVLRGQWTKLPFCMYMVSKNQLLAKKVAKNNYVLGNCMMAYCTKQAG